MPPRNSSDRYSDLPFLLQNYTQNEIAKMLGVSQAAIATHIKSKNILYERSEALQERIADAHRASLAHGRSKRKEKSDLIWVDHDLASMYQTMTQSQIAAIIGVSQVRVSQKLSELGLTKPKKS